MGNVERCDKTLPLNEMIFYVRRDAILRARWLTDLAGLAREFGLSDAEYEASATRTSGWTRRSTSGSWRC